MSTRENKLKTPTAVKTNLTPSGVPDMKTAIVKSTLFASDAHAWQLAGGLAFTGLAGALGGPPAALAAVAMVGWHSRLARRSDPRMRSPLTAAGYWREEDARRALWRRSAGVVLLVAGVLMAVVSLVSVVASRPMQGAVPVDAYCTDSGRCAP